MGVKQRTKSLKAKKSQLSDTFYQLKVLKKGIEPGNSEGFTPFDQKLDEHNLQSLRPDGIEIFQLNIGKLCNQTCSHCHVDAGPDKGDEMMTREDLETCLEIIEKHKIPTVDITGGAPEMHSEFRWFVSECYKLGAEVMARCNLTIIVANKKYHDIPEFYRDHKVKVVSSLPHFSEKRTNSQRGDGVFEDSIKALKMLNEVGYGKEDTGLTLDLVYNPTGAYLPGSQATLEREFKRKLKRKFDVVFNNLYAITNQPISRFLEYLIHTDQYESYMEKLINAFNPATIEGLMCKYTLSVSWDGYIYDCDFNQMLDLKVDAPGQHISEFAPKTLLERKIITGQHCYACTAGAGSSCGGEISE
ncbi:MAG: radical SAM/Cys-rich domain protein [Saprospirales bacterium]|nr:MAG: radical SAM/Cys-rich domain protein [Saprospirales bacterium]